MPEPIRPVPGRHPLAASVTVMEAVAHCHGAMAPERFHAWLEEGLRAAAGHDEPAGLVLFYLSQAFLAGAVAMTMWSGYEFFRDVHRARRAPVAS